MSSPSPPSPPFPDSSTSVNGGKKTTIHSGSPLLPTTIQIKLHVRKGQPQVRGRLSKDLPEPVIWDYKPNEDTYDILCARIRAKHPRVVGLVWPANAHPYIQPSHHSSQVNYKQLDDDNSDDLIVKAWRLEERRLKGNGTIYVNIFIYLAAPTTHATAGSNNAIQRATRPRIEAAHRLKNNVAQQRLAAYGPMTTAHHARHLARLPTLPPENDPLELLQGAIYQQTQFLDEQARLLNERRQRDTAERLAQFRTIRLKVNGTIVNYEVDVSSLREALGLPDKDLTSLVNFERDQISRPSEDMVDVDHLNNN